APGEYAASVGVRDIVRIASWPCVWRSRMQAGSLARASRRPQDHRPASDAPRGPPARVQPAGAAGSGPGVGIALGQVVLVVAPAPDDPAHDIAPEAARGQEAGLAQALRSIRRRPPETTLPDLVRARELGPVEPREVLADQFVGQVVLAQLLSDPGRAEAAGPAMDDRLGEPLDAQQALGLERVEHGLELLGRLGMRGELPAQLQAAVLAPGQVGKRAGAQAAGPARPPGGLRAGRVGTGCVVGHQAVARFLPVAGIRRPLRTSPACAPPRRNAP